MAEQKTGPTLRIQLLGPFDVHVEDHPLPPLRTRKGAHLLALLALRQPREVQREWLAANLWPESDIENAYYNLRRSLTDLRSALGSAHDCLFAPTSHSLCLASDGRVEVDVVRFDALMKLGDEASFEAAVALYRGALLEGFEAEWIIAEREFRHQTCLKALDKLASQAAERQDWSGAARWLKRVVALEPLQDEGQRRLIEALGQQGDYAAVALAYREYRERLRSEMNALPSPETTQLFQQLQAKASQNVPASRSIAIQKEPEGFTGYLPRLLTSFIGRGRELEKVLELLSSSRLVTLIGPEGIGKTRLAIRAAERAVGDFPDGIWFVDLAPLTDPSLLLQTIARTLKLREEAERPLLEMLLDFFRSKRLLLILDNCEPFQQTCGQLVEQLLAACPSLHILATSRNSLAIGQEAVWQVPPLSLPLKRQLPPPGEGLAFVLPQYEAARLFAERAAEAMPSFTITEQNAAATLRVVTRLDGLPLAIELAAARVRTLSVEQMAARLDNRFRLLARDASETQSLQQTLRATIDWSYDLLSEAERTLLRCLSVFTEGWTLEAAEQVCSAEGRREKSEGRREDSSFPSSNFTLLSFDALDILTDLIEKSFVLADREVGGERHYRMLESIREYALERLQESGEECDRGEENADRRTKAAL